MADELGDAADIFYISQKTLESVKDQLSKGEEISEEKVKELAFPENLGDEELMVPVDMRGVGEDFDDVEQMLQKLGNKGTAEAFVKAFEYFEANKDKEPEDERPKPMTAKEWREVLEEDQLDEGEEEDFLEDEEAEEENVDDDGEAEGPEAKKAKTG